ncbi:hypothetical protein HL653_15855 [Sphingomonas sp. AP4-R1]|uniref:hypothetical protein n=1 Tax=Sphingomonas sp. AP4-R1 TaxID=2735134 RepID=UPI001493C6D7|nr:hypothetical protein [Sphingomonas sp. AP4-R1]QJU59039.1 hypothetical protein HL653_15855 [Sphingomonas sp. AP4-R1]
MAWMLWLIVIGLLSVIARYAYIAAQPDRGCYTLIGRSPACEMAAKTGLVPARTSPKPKPKGYSAKDRAKLDHLIDDALLK